MRLLGFEISRTKSVPANLQAPHDRGRWWHSVIKEPFTGAWQRGQTIRQESVLTFSAVYRCVTLISSDIAKCRIQLVQEGDDGIWSEVKSSPLIPVLRRPNHYQTRVKFFEQWMVSKLLHGNAYVLKERDNRRVVVGLYILDPARVKPLVSPSGAIYYEIQKDNLSGVTDDKLAVPASEIIHDTMVPLFHPLCGVSPLTACGLAAAQGLNIQANSERFFANGSRPGGILTAPTAISDEVAKRLKDNWETNFGGDNIGKIAVLGDGLDYKTMSVNAVDAQLIEQLKWSSETVCSAFGVPSYKIGVGQYPTQTNIESLDQQYYSQCLQTHFENIELLLDRGLGLDEIQGKTYGTEFDLDDLLRMDTATMIKSEAEAVAGAIKSPNEARKRMNLPPVKGGESPMIQQQNFSLAAIAKRDAKEDPFSTSSKSRKKNGERDEDGPVFDLATHRTALITKDIVSQNEVKP